MYQSHYRNKLFKSINTDLEQLEEWFKSNSLCLNIAKSNFMLFSRQKNTKTLAEKVLIGNEIIQQVTCTKFLGILIDDKLQWSSHINHIKSKLVSSLFAIVKVKNFLPHSVLKTIYFALFHSHLNYGCILWGDAHKKLLKPIIILQKKAIRAIRNSKYNEPSSGLFHKSKILKFKDLYKLQTVQFMHSIYHRIMPHLISNKFERVTRPTRQITSFKLPLITFDSSRRSILYNGPKMWLELTHPALAHNNCLCLYINNCILYPNSQDKRWPDGSIATRTEAYST